MRSIRAGMMTVVVPAAVTFAALATLAGCGGQGKMLRSPNVRFGDPEIGRQVIEQVGCGSCHRIPGVRSADGLVGPPLDTMGTRSFIAGKLANNPENMVRWLLDPPKVSPGTAMPDLGLTEGQARDVTAYLANMD